VVEGAFEEWYLQHHRQVISSLVALCGEVALAQDAADEAFVRALSDWKRVQAMSSPAGWVYRVALNVLRRTLRRRALEVRLLLREFAQPTDIASHPEVWAAVRTLPERQRQAIVLRFVADLAEVDIAIAMGVSRGTVASTLAAARRRLTDLLGDPVNPEVLS
jgi:RNA polymerase sigma-70 factor (ECF subfamily)